ncbi:MAG: SAM-dependent methyltransferase [Pseudonocardiales bacterium]|nr:SAM-dependent methyltransferase [Pseudonocardiales bacterium]
MVGNQPQEYQVPTGVGLTAVHVAAARAAEGRRNAPLFDDPFAADFVTAAGAALSFTNYHPPAAQDTADLWAWVASYAVIRTRFFDDYFRDACAEGCRQVVILAAGLDTRAFRLSWPAGVRLFELDTPEVLTFKDQVLAERDTAPACQRVAINVDLRQDWPATLVQAGFHPAEPTAWLAEGLLIYLTQDERDQLLDRVRQLSAPGDWLAIEYNSEYMTQTAVQLMINSLSEPSSPDSAFLKTLWQSGTQEDPTSWLGRHGWQAHEYDASERAQFYGRPLPVYHGPVVQSALAARRGLVIAQQPRPAEPPRTTCSGLNYAHA